MSPFGLARRLLPPPRPLPLAFGVPHAAPGVYDWNGGAGLGPAAGVANPRPPAGTGEENIPELPGEGAPTPLPASNRLLSGVRLDADGMPPTAPPALVVRKVSVRA